MTHVLQFTGPRWQFYATQLGALGFVMYILYRAMGWFKAIKHLEAERSEHSKLIVVLFMRAVFSLGLALAILLLMAVGEYRITRRFVDLKYSGETVTLVYPWPRHLVELPTSQVKSVRLNMTASALLISTEEGEVIRSANKDSDSLKREYAEMRKAFPALRPP